MEKERLIKWDKRFLEFADYISQWSRDPSTKVGAVICDDKKRVLGVGYNGFPRHVDDDPSLYEDREMKYARVVHAEANAILNSTGGLTGASLFCTHFPCSSCAGLIIQSGIHRVVSYLPEESFGKRFEKSHSVSEQMFNQADIGFWLYNKEYP